MTTPSPFKVLTIVGTRPEIIRLSAVIDLLDQTVDHVLVHTGQNYDRQLNDIFFDDLGLRAPDHVLDTDTSSLGALLGSIIMRTEEVLELERPDAVVILGDTNSSIAALIAKRRRVPVFHLEAGNRSFDENVPEETNRRMIDHVADYALVYTEHARRNLLSEGIHPSRIVVIGSPMHEVLGAHRAAFESCDVLAREQLTRDGFFLVSLHREENVDDATRLTSILTGLEQLADEHDVPVLVSTHPRTRRRVEELDATQFGHLRFHEPFGFVDYNALQMNARAVLSDSGTISEESALLGFAAVTLRDRIERPEAIDTGSIITAGSDLATLRLAVDYVIRRNSEGVRATVPADYQIADTAHRVVAFILSSTHAHHDVLGLRHRS